MRTISKIFAVAAAVVVALPPLFASPPPTPANAFVGRAPGARAIAMGTAFCAVANDPSTNYYNPAGLSRLESNYFALTYEAIRQSTLTTAQIFAGEALKGMNLDSLILAGPKGALSWRPLSNTEFSRPGSGGDFEDTQVKINAYTLSGSHVYSGKLSTGLNISYLTGQIAQSGFRSGVPFITLADGYGFTTDFGFLYAAAPQMRLGLTLENILGFMWWEKFDNEQLPFGVRAGFAYEIANVFTFASDVEKKYFRKADEETVLHFGVEQNIGKLLQLRAGIFGTDLNDVEQTHITAGLGYQQNNFGLSLTGEKYRLNATDVYRYLFSLNLPV